MDSFTGKLKMHHIPFSAGAPPWTTLRARWGVYYVLPGSLVGWDGGHLLQHSLFFTSLRSRSPRLGCLAVAAERKVMYAKFISLFLHLSPLPLPLPLYLPPLSLPLLFVPYFPL